MKVIAFLTEPASYTIDLVKKVYSPNNIDYKFLVSSSYSNPNDSEKFDNHLFLNNYSIISRFYLLKQCYKKYDAIIFSGYNSFSFLLLWFIHVCAYDKKPISIISDTPLNIPSNFFKRIIKKYYLRYIFKNSFIHGFAGGNGLHKDLFSFYGMSFDRIHFLPMVIDVDEFKFSSTRKRNSAFSFLYVGRFIKRKQIEHLIEEFLSKYNNNPSVQLVLVGDGECYDDIHNKYSNFNNILFRGRLTSSKLKKEYQLAHVFVLAAYNENWGLVINEAMSASLAVLSNKGIGANYDLINDKVTGLIFDSSIKGDLAKKMEFLYRNKKQYNELTKNAYSLMHEYWNFNLYLSQLNLGLSKILKHK